MTTTLEPETCDQPIPFDRRLAGRAPASGDYVAVVIHGDDAHIASVEMADRSTGGLGVKSPIAMPSGAICHLHPHGVVSLADVGRVVRCTALDDGTYSIGLVSLSRVAA